MPPSTWFTDHEFGISQNEHFLRLLSPFPPSWLTRFTGAAERECGQARGSLSWTRGRRQMVNRKPTSRSQKRKELVIGRSGEKDAVGLFFSDLSPPGDLEGRESRKILLFIPLPLPASPSAPHAPADFCHCQFARWPLLFGKASYILWEVWEVGTRRRLPLEESLPVGHRSLGHWWCVVPLSRLAAAANLNSRLT